MLVGASWMLICCPQCNAERHDRTYPEGKDVASTEVGGYIVHGHIHTEGASLVRLHKTSSLCIIPWPSSWQVYCSALGARLQHWGCLHQESDG